MTLQEIFDQLKYGELSGTDFAGHPAHGITPADEGIREDDKPKLIGSIQLGLTALYKRFRLKVSEIKLERQEGQASYVLHSDFAQSNTDSQAPVKYIDDSDYPFIDDLLEIEAVKDKDGNELDLNVRDKPLSLRTLRYNTLVIPEDLEGDTFTVVYRADHPKIDPVYGQYISFAQEIELPAAYLQALLYFVASRVMNPIGIASEFHEGNNWAAKYEMECQRLEGQGMDISEQSQETQFEERGWC